MTFRRSFLAGICSVLLVAGVAPAQEKKKKDAPAPSPGTSEYFPLAVGTEWEYRTAEGKIVTKIVKHELVGKVTCARLQATAAGNKVTDEYLRITADGVYRHQASGQNISPPLRFLKLPPEKDDEWEIESVVLGKTLKGKFKITISEQLTVLEKTYQNVIVCTSEDFTVDGQKLSHTYYIAKGFGIVKQVVSFAGQEIVLELEKFKAAPASP